MSWIQDQHFDELENCRELYQENQQIKDKFNGNIITELIGKTGKDLGDIIVAFKKNWNDDKERYRAFLLVNTKEDVALYFQDWYKNNYAQWQTKNN